MSRINYGHEGGSPLRWIVGIFLAAGIAIVMVAGGRLGAQELCDGACTQLQPMADFLKQPFPVFSDTLTWCLGLAIIATFLLWMALGSRQNGLALILILALGLLGAAAAGIDPKKDEEAAPVEEDVLEDELPELTTYDSDAIIIGAEEVPDPVEELLTKPESENICPAGNYWNGEGCLTCEIAQTVPVAEKLNFIPASLEASWDYADAHHVRFANETDMLPVGDVTVNGTAPCTRDAILVIGSASSDGPLDRNLDRARSRARKLAEHMNTSCGETVPEIFAISIGQSTAERDNFRDRALTVIGLDVTDGEEITQALVEEEFGYLLGSGTASQPLLSRIDYFPRENWSWVQGGAGTVDVRPSSRPSETVMTLREGASESCREAK